MNPPIFDRKSAKVEQEATLLVGVGALQVTYKTYLNSPQGSKTAGWLFRARYTLASASDC